MVMSLGPTHGIGEQSPLVALFSVVRQARGVYVVPTYDLAPLRTMDPLFAYDLGTKPISFFCFFRIFVKLASGYVKLETVLGPFF